MDCSDQVKNKNIDPFPKIHSFGALLSVYAKDHPQSLHWCLESLNRQTKKLDQCLVVVEGEISDDLENTLQNFSSIITLLRVPKQVGSLGFSLPACLNLGLHEMKTSFVLKVDSDDISCLDRCERTAKFLENNPNIILLGGQIEEYNVGFDRSLNRRLVPCEDKAIRKMAPWKNPFNGPTVAFCRETALHLGGYPLVGANEDYAFWAMFLKLKSPVANLAHILVYQQGGGDLVLRRSTNRYRTGEYEALKSIHSTGLFSTFQLLLHVVFKWTVRSLPNSIIGYIYLFLRAKPEQHHIPLDLQEVLHSIN